MGSFLTISRRIEEEGRDKKQRTELCFFFPRMSE